MENTIEVETRFGTFIVLEKENDISLAQHVNGGKIILLKGFPPDIYSLIKLIEYEYCYSHAESRKIKASKEEKNRKKPTEFQELREYIKEQERKYENYG